MGEKGETPELTGSELRIAVVVARFNEDVTRRLLRGALNALKERGVEDPDVLWVPGSLELPVTALTLAERGNHDAIALTRVAPKIIADDPFRVAEGISIGSIDKISAGLEIATQDTLRLRYRREMCTSFPAPWYTAFSKRFPTTRSRRILSVRTTRLGGPSMSTGTSGARRRTTCFAKSRAKEP